MRLLLLIACAWASCASAEERPWVYEFEFSYKVHAHYLVSAACNRPNVQKHVFDDRVNRYFWVSSSCGGSDPVYNHFLGRKCIETKRVTFECGWRHFSHAGDSSETYYDAIGIKGRFTFGARRYP